MEKSLIISTNDARPEEQRTDISLKHENADKGPNSSLE